MHPQGNIEPAEWIGVESYTFAHNVIPQCVKGREDLLIQHDLAQNLPVNLVVLCCLRQR